MSRPQGPAPLWDTKPKVSRAARFLRLTPDADEAPALTAALKSAPVRRARADDVLRAARREPLPLSDPDVQRIARKVRSHTPLRPVLLVTTSRGTTIADGLHKLSFAWHRDPRSAVAVVHVGGPTDTGENMGRKKLRKIAKAQTAAATSGDRLADALTTASREVRKIDSGNLLGREQARQSLRKSQLAYLEATNPLAADIWKQHHAGIDYFPDS